MPAFERAVRAAPRGVDDGTVYWTDRADRLEIALALEPEAPAARTLEAVYVLTVATGEALAHLLPPVVPIAFAWPGDILLDGARAGRVCAALAPVADPRRVPPWLVLGLTVDLAPSAASPATCRTDLVHDQGAGDVTGSSWSRASPATCCAGPAAGWKSGLGSVRSAWNLRCFRRGRHGELTSRMSGSRASSRAWIPTGR